MVVQPHKSSLGNLDANVMALLAYLASAVLGWIPVISYVAWAAPLVIFFIEKQSSFVKFHSMQAFLLGLVGMIFGLIVSLIVTSIIAANPFALDSYALAGTLSTIIGLVFLVFAIIAMVKAYKYEEYKLPLIGGLAASLTEKFGK